MPTPRLTIPVPTDFLLHRDSCSYGYFLLAPNHWHPGDRRLDRALHLPGGPALVRVRQPGPADCPLRPKPGSPLDVRSDRPLSAADRAAAVALVTRMLRLDESRDSIRAFHALDPRWRRTGEGRLCRSPSFFEDVVKTVTSCNVGWPSTVGMNRRLCEAFGEKTPSGVHTFPTPSRLARQRPAALRGRCGVGYRDARIVELAKMFARGRLGSHPVAWYEDPATPDDALREALIELPGIGPYAAANIMQLLGRYTLLPLDSESVRHGRTVLGMTGPAASIMKRVARHFEPFGEHRFRSYWFELLGFYASKRGKPWTWKRDEVGATFTAAKF
jgi:3-methyladenine DNA glycosylase/8-oxoguanine DNA glycosylase